MAQNLQNIFDSITPDNIKSIPAIKDAMAIFIETLEELSKESIDIRKMFLNPVIKEELVKIYLDDLYKVFKTLQFNQKVVNKIERLNAVYGVEYYKIDVIRNIANYINEEHFLTFKSYKEKKGTPDAIKYIYELVGRKLLSEDNFVPFALTEVSPFTFNVSGNLPSELYEAVVRPLAHPLGFVYQYNQLVSLLLEDVVFSTIAYKTNALEVRSLLPNGTTDIINYKYEIDGITPRVVVDLITSQTNTTTTKKIVFADGKYLEQVTTSLGQTQVYYKALNGDILIAYNVYQSSIYFDYEVILTTTLQEDFNNITNSIPIDNYARLNPDNNALSHIETGFNSTRDIDGDYLFPGGKAQAGAASTLTLANSAAGQADDLSAGQRITIVYGTGAGQGFRTVVSSRKNLLPKTDINTWAASINGTAAGTKTVVSDTTYGNVTRLVKTAGADADRYGAIINVPSGLSGNSYAVQIKYRVNVAGSSGHSLYVDANKVGGGLITKAVALTLSEVVGVWNSVAVNMSGVGGGTLAGAANFYVFVTGPVNSSVDFVFPQLENGLVNTAPIVTVGTAAVGVAVNTPWTIVPDATSIYALSTGLELTGTGRQENYFQPSSSADLKMLEGKFEKNVVINHPYDGFETQHIKYTDVVNVANQVTPFVMGAAAYDAQNIENAHEICKEHLIIQENAIFAKQNKATISSYIKVVDVVIGTNGINIGGADDLGTTYKVFDPITNNNTADKVVATIGGSGVGQQVTLTAGITYTFSVWVLSQSNIVYVAFCTTGANSSNLTTVGVGASTSWTRVAVSYTPTSSGTYGVGMFLPVALQTFYAWGAQLEVGSTATTYIPTEAQAAGNNLLSFSQAFDNVAWAYARWGGAATITANSLDFAAPASSIIDFNDNILYRYFYGSITNDEPVNMTATVDDIFTGVVTRAGVVLADHNYAQWLARFP